MNLHDGSEGASMKGMSKETREQPYKVLGAKLKLIRQKLQESVRDVSGGSKAETDSAEVARERARRLGRGGD